MAIRRVMVRTAGARHRLTAGVLPAALAAIPALGTAEPAAAGPAATAEGPTVADPSGIELSVDRTEVDVNTPSATVTVTLPEPVAYPHSLAVHDDTGRHVYMCTWGHACPAGATSMAASPNNETRTYTAYVSQDRASTGPPIVDVLDSSSVSVAKECSDRGAGSDCAWSVGLAALPFGIGTFTRGLTGSAGHIAAEASRHVDDASRLAAREAIVGAELLGWSLEAYDYFCR